MKKNNRENRIENEIIGLLYSALNPLTLEEVKASFYRRASYETIKDTVNNSSILTFDLDDGTIVSRSSVVTLDVMVGSQLYFYNQINGNTAYSGTEYTGLNRGAVYCRNVNTQRLANNRGVNFLGSELKRCFQHDGILSNNQIAVYLYTITS